MTARSASYSGVGFVLFMSVMCSLSPFAMSLIVPAFPDISADFSKPVADVQFLLSGYLLGLGVAQPVHGILCDRFGRRPILILGFSVFVIASLASVFVTSWTALIILRILQGVGVSAGTVISRTIINDVQPREEAAVTLSYVSIAMGIGPIVAPIVGGIASEALGWRSLYVGGFLVGVVILILALTRLQETRPADQRTSKSFSVLLRDYRRLLTSPKFLGYTMIFGFGQGVFFSFLPVAPDYFENVLGHGRMIFVLNWILLSLAFMFGSFLGTRIVRRLGMDRVIFLGSLWLIFAHLLMVMSYAFLGDGANVVMPPFMLALVGTGMICPLALAGSISLDPKLAGTASGLSSSLGLILGGMFAVVSGSLYDGSLWPFIILAGLAIWGNMLGSTMSRRGEAA